MKRLLLVVSVRRLVLLLALMGAMLVVAAPATANSKPTTGSRISLYFPPTAFAANAPFYVEHGFACDLSDVGCIATQISGLSRFSLYVDGVLQPSTVDVDTVAGSGGFIEKRYLTNFPDGLPAGVHTFVGIWNQEGGISTVTDTITFT